jgi:arylsulfatase/uncharacterized sulfatase
MGRINRRKIKKRKAKAMAVNAAMIEAMIFMLVAISSTWKKNELMENTVFVITSDNGPEGSGPLVAGMDLWLKCSIIPIMSDWESEVLHSLLDPTLPVQPSPSSFFKFYAEKVAESTISGDSLPIDQQQMPHLR